MGLFLAAVGLFVGYGAALLGSKEVRYLSRAGLEEIQILKNRRSLEAMVTDPATDPGTRGLLELVLAARAHAASLGFEAGDTYTSYSDVGRDTLLLVLSASPTDCLCPHTWKYPIVGRVPYKGFFDPGMAQREAAKLAARGLDIYLRPSGAFSTLGWFEDPLLSTALTTDSVELAATVFHEIAHNSLYIKSATAFNESFAQYAGYRAAEDFFRSRGDTAKAVRAGARLADEQVMGAFYRALTDRLETFYRSGPKGDSLTAGRLAIAQWARSELAGPVAARLQTTRIGSLADGPINNARLVGITIYRTHLDWFDAWHARHDGAIRGSVAALRNLMVGAEGDEAFARLERGLAGLRD
jgi:predicted aminopeptidase